MLSAAKHLVPDRAQAEGRFFAALRMTALVLCVFPRIGFADQYRSETRELATPPPEQSKSQDAAALLKQVTDPYARALLLREMAGKAVDQKDYVKAVQMLEQALAQNALSGIAGEEMRRSLAQLYIATGNYKKVLPELEKQAKAANAPAETLIALGAAYVDAKRFKEAIPFLKKGIEQSKAPDPSWKRALLSALLSAGQDKEALPLLEQAVRETPNDAEAWQRLCALTLKYGSRERALGYLELAQRLGFLDGETDRLRLVTLTAQLGAPFEAASLMQAWLKSSQLPSNTANQQLLASLWLRAREKKLALMAMDVALASAPTAALYQTQAQLLLEREDYSGAAEAMERALALGAKDGKLLLSLAMARYQQADVDEALRVFRLAAQDKASRKTAEEWVKYLENNLARDQAMSAARERMERLRDEDVALSGRLLGGAVVVGGGEAREPVSAGAPGASQELSPVGAVRGGNRDGTIPPWTGGLSKAEAPASYRAGGPWVDPYPNDRPQYTVTATNAGQYQEILSKGHQALLKKYPSYQMPVYETRRSASYPQPIYDATQLNLGRAKLEGSDALTGARLGFPFARPQSGVEILWNHRTRYRGDTVQATYTQAVVNADGETQRNKQTFKVYFRYGNVADPVEIEKKNILLYGVTHVSETGRTPDFVALFHETANSIEQPRNIWVLIVKIGKMLRIPPIGYDQPFPASEGLEFIDMVDMYNGAFDRYVWKLVGKRELLIPYNATRLSDGSIKYGELLQPYHPKASALRYEKHRVWVIEASERGGSRHVFGKRTFYVDEDSWNVVLVENLDRQGNLWRFQEGHLIQMYDAQYMTAVPTFTYDLKDGRYFANRLFAEDKPFVYNLPMKETEFFPAQVKTQYSR